VTGEGDIGVDVPGAFDIDGHAASIDVAIWD
jgi:hypothetical protein